MARKLFVVRFTVEGVGEFPFDMLRYDSCHPRDEGQARRLGWTYATATDPAKLRQVELESRGRPNYWSPNIERWRSFGWRVLHDSLQAHEHA